ncbi:proteobacterial dedicated sortase system histidine kinase [Colwellia sp. 6M3]|jgi:dedicated sortase system histidine kinase|uniref:proteobacterial dedicated sortase system histidine kinase n=1 Tax=Colwellia sp. 6M3 TaxID=2759849 RepID=UPI0015F3875F|nr:proteobacterial dedicated sortase system histidine kinase [Colwellia sp. 6M3]MBA6417483.1 proteobacterial dedicated sortase system histidine kinase [Colwellia sp. 6M3]
MAMKWRFGLRSKLLLLSGFLFTIPWFGYQYVWEMEKYLRYGQEQTIIGTARALATAMHERANLFNNQASFLPSVEKGKDLYSYGLSAPIQLDGLNQDWPDFANKAHFYQQNNQLYSQLTPEQLSINFTAAVGTYGKYLYLYFVVIDDKVIYRDSNARSIVNNDHLELAFINPQNVFSRFIISNKTTGWIDAYRITDITDDIPVPARQIQGHWRDTPQGYNVEVRVPLTEFNDNIAFAVHDVDSPLGVIEASLGSADPSSAETLGTILVPSPEIERIVKGMSYTNSSIWVVDQHHRVLATTGNIKKANGVWNKRVNLDNQREDNADTSFIYSVWLTFENNILKPLYEIILTQPPRNFIDQLYDSENLTGKHIESALAGEPMSQWRLSTDQQAVVLSAAYPIFIDEHVKGAVIVEETTNGIRTLRNQALEKLFSSILAIMLLGALAFFLFASRISNRIRTLSNQAEMAIDEHGRISGNVDTSTTNDEIGDLSRSFSTAVNRLGQYNHYLENMSSRLSHELRTPIAVVRTSLETLAIQQQTLSSQNLNNENGQTTENENPYLVRAQHGIERLSLILTNMNEATRIEQMLQNTDKTLFDLAPVFNGCMQGYRLIYPNINFAFNDISSAKLKVLGSPEHIAQLLDKVIANAVEFSNDANVEVSVKESNQQVILTISNNGELLPEQMSEQLFDSMVSIRTKHNNEQPHLGLGLYIARLICQFHNGTIKAVNKQNAQGVDVLIKLPLVK